MGVPKHHHSTSKAKRRKSQVKITLPTFAPCSSCEKLTLQHAACRWCGMYKGRIIIVKKEKTKKKK